MRTVVGSTPLLVASLSSVPFISKEYEAAPVTPHFDTICWMPPPPGGAADPGFDGPGRGDIESIGIGDLGEALHAIEYQCRGRLERSGESDVRRSPAIKQDGP